MVRTPASWWGFVLFRESRMHFALLSLVLACGGGSTIEVVTESHANGTVLAQTR